MKRTPLIITFLVLIIVVGGIWSYQAMQVKKITAWDLISKDVALVFEVNQLSLFIQKIDGLPIVKKLFVKSEGLKRIAQDQLLYKGKTYVTVFPTASDDFEFLIYIELGANFPISYLKDFSEGIQKNLSLKKRLYNGVEINEFFNQKESQFAFAIVEDILILSKSSFLLEGAIRMRNAEQKQLFKYSNPSLFRLPTLQSDEGNIYLNAGRLLDLTRLVLQPNLINDKLSLLGNGLADLKVSEDGILINGFIINKENDILSLFSRQNPQKIEIESVVSNRVAAIKHFGISDIASWFEDQNAYVDFRDIRSIDSLEQEMARLSVSLESIRQSIGNQIATCYLSKEGGVVNVIKANESANQINIFDELSSKISERNKDSLYVENYAGYEIKLIDYENFLYQLLYPLAPTAEQCFFVRIGPHFLFSENVELLKLFIDDIDSENTWGKSVVWNKFFSSSLQESNVNLFFDGKLLSLVLREKFNAKWRQLFDSTNFLSLNKGSLQLSKLESNYYMNVSLDFAKNLPGNMKLGLERTTFEIGTDISSAVKIVRSHITKDIELVIQDSLNNFYLLSKDLKILWKQPILDKITDDVDQLDFLANGKLQYFFTTANQVHLIDRLGRYVDGFPKRVPMSASIEYSSIVDYDRSKRYRYLLTDTKGNLILTDKNGNPLEGWNPLSLNGRMFSSTRHYRILGKDYFIGIQQSGLVHLMTRRGEVIKGFPLDLGFRPAGDFSVTIGSTLSASHFTAVSEDGIKVQFGVDGQIRKREVLLKRISASQFSLVKSVDESSYVFLRVDPGRIAVLNSDGELLFEIENMGSTQWQLTHIENGLKEKYYCLYDRQQNFSYFIDDHGQQLLTQPVESSRMPTLYYDDKSRSLSIYNVFGSSISSIKIKQ